MNAPSKKTRSVQKKWFRRLKAAKQKASPVKGLIEDARKLSIDEAYQVQDLLIADRLQQGQRLIGWKVGATSQAVMRQLQIEEPIYGRMTSESRFSTLRQVAASDFCQLAMEAEIAIVMGRDLKGGEFTAADIIAAAEGVMGAVELVDCRIKGWKPLIEEAIADNSLHAGFITGPSMLPASGIDLTRESVILRKNGQLLASACGVEALGNPFEVVTWLANKLVATGQQIEAGQIVLTGSLTAFNFVAPGDTIDVSFSNLGRIQFYVHA